METTVTLTMNEQQRAHVLAMLTEGRCTAAEAAECLGRSVRQVRRMLRRFGEEGVPGVVHGNRGRRPANTVPEAVRAEVVKWARDPYADCNDHHLRDLLEERHGIGLGVSTVRRLRRGAGLLSPRKRRAPKHRTRRPRRAQPGMLLQLDGSPFHWLGPDQPPVNLLAAIDDATNEVFALFRQEEDTVGYLRLLRQVLRRRGIPLGVYSDRHAIFRLPPNHTLSPDEQLLGRLPLTQFGRACRDLAIGQIHAQSPQAKGRVEKLFNTLQDRLAQELRLAGITTLEEANAFLPAFLERYNRRFPHPPADPQSAYRPAPPRADQDRILALQFARSVANDHTVTFGGLTLDLPRATDRSLAGRTILVQIALDGQMTFWLNDQCLGRGPKLRHELRTDPSKLMAPLRHAQTAPPPTPAPPPSPTPRQGTAVKPADNHPWRRYRQPRPKVLQSPPPTEG